MTRTTRSSATLLATAFLAVCGGTGEADGPGTEGITRSLLDQETGGSAPSTRVEWASDLPPEETEIGVPELGFNHGSPQAPLKVLELSDFGCGFCRRFHQETFAALQAEFIDSDRVEWKFMPFITGIFPNSLAVTEAAECVLEQDPEGFTMFSGRLWERQSEWKEARDPAPLVRGWMEELGGDAERYDACMETDRRLGRVASATGIARQLGVRGTPTFWILGFGPVQGALPLETFRQILRSVLMEMDAPGGAPSPSDVPSDIPAAN